MIPEIGVRPCKSNALRSWRDRGSGDSREIPRSA